MQHAVKLKQEKFPHGDKVTFADGCLFQLFEPKWLGRVLEI